jgi:large subunit ribosomal protein L25
MLGRIEDHMAEALKVELRKNRGTREARKLRREGKVPAVLYGHGEKAVSLAIGHDDLATVMRHHSRLVDLKGGANESALIRELQWDPYGVEVLHVDFARVSADERIEVQVSVELRGTAPGVNEGGVIEHLLHEVMVECLATAIPEKIQVRINQLNKGDSITIAQLEIPPGVKVLTDPEAIVVQCVEAAVEPEAEVVTEAAEPEVIGRKPEEEGAEEEETK